MGPLQVARRPATDARCIYWEVGIGRRAEAARNDGRRPSARLFEDLCNAAGPVAARRLDVEKASALAIEVLIAAQRQWEADGMT
jgi:hypothetical protein